uniref:Alginate lyase family protein n=1 Tax=Schlesneria paludicola TaxID=360056 RepID=A0A7C4QNA0_9PLAN
MWLPVMIRKLSKMSVHEIHHRISERVQQGRERLAWRLSRKPAQQPCGDEKALLRQASSLVAGTRVGELDRLRRCRPEMGDAILAQAASRCCKIRSGCWTMLGHDFDLTGDIDWHGDPRTGHQFPRVFYADVSLHQNVGGPVDVKYVWELGRQQYVAELARGWLLTGDDVNAGLARGLILGWIKHNPLYEGVHWTSGLEAAMRAVSWIWALAALAEWPGWSNGDMSRLAGSLAEHAEYLSRHLSYYSSPYNHLIGEATGLYLISQVLKEHPATARWRDKARQVLLEHGPRQFYSDGFCVEQAMGYHFFTLGFVMLAVVAARGEGAPLDTLEKIVPRAFRAGAAFQQPDGRWPAIGDVDSARSLPVSADDLWDFTGLYSLAAAVFREPSLKLSRSQPGEELFWLLGAEGVQTWEALGWADADHSTLLPESGYAVHRRGDNWVLLDAGPIAHGLHADATPSTAHGHLDLLQVLCFWNGRPLLIDPGMPFYFGDKEWVHHFRSAAAHNTLEIEGLPFAKDAGGLAWSEVRTVSQLQSRETDGRWEAQCRVTLPHHAGGKRHGEHVERVVQFDGQHLHIADTVCLAGPHIIVWYWQLPSEQRPQLVLANSSSLQATMGSISICWVCNAPLRSYHLASSLTPLPHTTYSPGYGQRARRSQLTLSLQAGPGLTILRTTITAVNCSTRSEPFPATHRVATQKS